ncbi:MAG: T9SS type A sorting domain-containing protein [Bacteroidales bacterium]|nr:T9SS type A sorting domain-containing protein [Bacteroidales bacterium]
MKKSAFTFAIFMIVFFSGNPAHSQWIQVDPGISYDIFTISAFDNGRLIACGGSGSILMSDDKGISWNVATLSYESIVNVHAFGNFCIAISDQGFLFQSNDYGESWQNIANLAITLRGLHIVNPDKAYISGQYEMVFASSDNFSSWNPVEYVFGPGYWLRDITFPNEQNGYVVGDGGRAYKTPNAGYGWFLMDTKTDENLLSVYFPSPDTGYTCGNNSTILKTTDGGITWFSSFNLQMNHFRNVFFLTNDEGYVSGNDGIIMHTSDGGINWEMEETNVNTNLRDFYYIPEIERLLVCGHGGVILYNNLTTNLEEIQKPAESKVSIKAFPNPANDQITFEINNTKGDALNLTIYDTQGKSMLQFDDLIKGIFQADISTFPAGSYQYVFSMNKNIILSEQFIKQ